LIRIRTTSGHETQHAVIKAIVLRKPRRISWNNHKYRTLGFGSHFYDAQRFRDLFGIPVCSPGHDAVNPLVGVEQVEPPAFAFLQRQAEYVRPFQLNQRKRAGFTIEPSVSPQ
jgi:hypothetical protein